MIEAYIDAMMLVAAAAAWTAIAALCVASIGFLALQFWKGWRDD